MLADTFGEFRYTKKFFVARLRGRAPDLAGVCEHHFTDPEMRRRTCFLIEADLAGLDFQVGVTAEEVRQSIQTALSGKLAGDGVAVQGKDGDSELRFRIPLSHP